MFIDAVKKNDFVLRRRSMSDLGVGLHHSEPRPQPERKAVMT